MFQNMLLIKNAKLTTPVIIATHARNKIYTNKIYKNFNKLLGNHYFY